MPLLITTRTALVVDQLRVLELPLVIVLKVAVKASHEGTVGGGGTETVMALVQLTDVPLSPRTWSTYEVEFVRAPVVLVPKRGTAPKVVKVTLAALVVVQVSVED